jgi:hypothetical protein
VCWHIRTVQATTASMVAELDADLDAPLRAWVAIGSPCVSVYLPVLLPVVPAELAEPATWQRLARLRDRVEDDGDTLLDVRRVLGPVEAVLWDRADEAAGDPVAQATLATEAWPMVDDALRRLGA